MMITNKNMVVAATASLMMTQMVIVTATLAYAQIPSTSTTQSPFLPDTQTLTREVNAYMQQQGWADTSGISLNRMNMSLVAEGIVLSRYLDNSVMIVVLAQNAECWSGSILGSDFIQTSWEGCGTGYHSVACYGLFGLYSVAIQRTSDVLNVDKDFSVQVWKDGQLLKQGNTQAEYGVISIAGSCS